LQKFHNFEMAGQEPDLDVLLHIYEKEFQELGYESERHKRQTYEQGKESLTEYFKVRKENFIGEVFDQEKAFRIPIDGVALVGRIDRIDVSSNHERPHPAATRLPSPSQGEGTQRSVGGEVLEVIDYKTGKVKDQKTVDKDAQLTIYAMACQQLFGKLPESLCLYFVNDNVKVTTTRSEKDVAKKKKEISDTIQLIKQGKFKAKPGFGCQYCPYKKICGEAVG
jgi:RecB family exonuclease